MSRSIRVVCFAILSCVAGWSQSDTGSINGTVTDPSGAGVPQATIKILNTNTGAERSVTTADGGTYSISPLSIGYYVITVTTAGFSTTTIQDVALQAGQTRTINTSLQLASTSTSIVVQAAATDIEKSSAELGSDIGATEIRNLPMNGRGIYELYRRQAEQLKQRRSSWVRLRAPRGTGAVQTYSGRHLIVREDGTVDMSAEDAEAFIRDGFTKLEEWEPGEDT